MLKIRLSQTGKKDAKTYRVVVAEEKYKRDGRFITILGYINPNTKPPEIKIDYAQLKSWQKKGAKLSEGIKKYIHEKIT